MKVLAKNDFRAFATLFVFRMLIIQLILLFHSYATVQVDNFNCQTEEENIKCFPDVWLIGASKCATTTMAYYLEQNKDIVQFNDHGESNVFDEKESSVFDEETDHDKLLSKIEKSFKRSHEQNQTVPHVLYYRPDNFYFPEAPRRISRALGSENAKKVKFLVMLREPAARTFSSWAFKHSDELDDRSWPEAVEEDLHSFKIWRECMEEHAEEGIQQTYEHTCHPQKFNSRHTKIHHIAKSAYNYQFSHWFSYFPAHNFYVLFMEDFVSDPQGELQKALEFFGVEPMRKSLNQEALQKLFHKHKNTTKKKPMDPNIQTLINTLRQFFQRYNEALAKMLGLKYSSKSKSYKTTRVKSSLQPQSNVTWFTNSV